MDNVEAYKYTKGEISELFKDDLKNHYFKRNNVGLINVGIVREYKEKNIEKDVESNIVSDKFKYKLALKILGALSVVASIFVYEYFPDEIKSCTACTWIKNEYNKDFNKTEVIENIEEVSKVIYNKIEKIVPESVYNSIVNKYINSIKPEIINFSFANLFENKNINNTVAVFNEDEIEINTEDKALAEEAITTSSEISLMDMDKNEIVSKNISIIIPVNGTVTSEYGAREEIFKNVGYHTGIDIANTINTPIKSATDGVVMLAEFMDKYYGNNIEIENNGVIFKYAHLNQINVKVGDKITQGEIIGLMGSTGASTGSHLHFEIKINGRSVDPELLIKIR